MNTLKTVKENALYPLPRLVKKRRQVKQLTTIHNRFVCSEDYIVFN